MRDALKSKKAIQKNRQIAEESCSNNNDEDEDDDDDDDDDNNNNSNSNNNTYTKYNFLKISYGVC